MLDIKLIREKPELVRENLKRRCEPEFLRMVDGLIECDKLWRQHLTRLNDLRRERNRITMEIASLKKRDVDATLMVSRAKEMDKEIANLERLVGEYEEKARYYLMRLPNLLHDSVPIGKDEHDNVTVRTWGEIPRFNFPVKD
ncbi:MAG: serine--tRNA ligase, partial [Candidatus Bathyarchaeia archaeon]